jgi:Spy/CpxP family protein refolding chaperone
MAKMTKSPLLLTLGVAAALVAGGGAAYWYFSQPKAGPGDMLLGAEVIPQNALMAVAVTTDAGQWQQLRQFGTPQSQAAFDKNLAQLRDRLLTANGFDYQRDIQPWVGEEVTFAFLGNNAPFTAPPGTTQQPVVIVLPIRDGLKAKQILESPRPGSGQVSDRTYKGFQIKETQTAGQGYSATVLDGKFLVVTTEPKATDQTIDSYTEKTTLSTIPGYAQALGQIKAEQRFGKVYINLPAAAAISAANAGKTLTPEQQAQQSQGLAAIATLAPDGIQFKSVSWLKPDSQRTLEVKNEAQLMPSRLPADTILMVSGGNLQQFWRDYSQGAGSNPITPIDPKLIQEGLKSTVGMDWEQDFLPWMKGEFAIALTGAPEGTSPNLPFSILFLTKTSDRRAAEASLKKLDDAMVNRYKFQVQESQVNGQPVIAWTIPQSGTAINRGWLDGDIAFLSLGAPIANAIVPRPTQPLQDSEAFKAAITPGLNPNNGHFFADVDQAINSKRFPILQLPPGNKELVAAIRSIGVTAAIKDNRTIRYDVFTTLQKGNPPKPLPAPTVPSASPTPTP